MKSTVKVAKYLDCWPIIVKSRFRIQLPPAVSLRTISSAVYRPALLETPISLLDVTAVTETTTAACGINGWPFRRDDARGKRRGGESSGAWIKNFFGTVSCFTCPGISMGHIARDRLPPVKISSNWTRGWDLMRNYANLTAILQGLRLPLTEAVVTSNLAPRLVETWLNDYGRVTGEYDVVETRAEGFSYLFDISAERLIAAWGLSKGKDVSPRAIIATRMKGHPLTNTVGGKRYHRGHAVPHTMGGRTDINLVPQLGLINSGPFQELERLAVATPGSLYFTYWSYPDARTQRPSGVEQGCLIAGSIPKIVNFRN